MDWTDQTESAFRHLLQQTLNSLPHEETLVIEFQGGEPTLRSDIIARTLAQLDQSGARFRLVICTNLNRVNSQTETIFAHPKVMISTSLDGPTALHQRNRTQDDGSTSRFFSTLRRLLALYGLSKISALPTITQADYDRLPQIIETYVQEGFSSIFLRPVSPHGFARKTTQNDDGSQWHRSYLQALEDLFQRNMTATQPVREYGLEVALRRIFWPSFTGHVDLRSPNPAGRDSLMIDYDGKLYPSDEARMLARLKRIDLSIGQISNGIDQTKAQHLSWNQMGETNEDCLHCAYQPFCGVDSIDDIARYDRTDLPRHMTRFCQDQMALFGFIFRKIEQADPVALANFNGHLNGDFSETPFLAPPYLVEAP
jgi:radical SAM protein with 4Fe4S-binding SPASM domain